MAPRTHVPARAPDPAPGLRRCPSATDAITAQQNRSPPAHGYRPATAHCSTTPSTPPQCGYPCTADRQWLARRPGIRSTVDLTPRQPGRERSDLTEMFD